MVKNMLRRKLARDMQRSGMQFIALILLCVLGTFLYAGLDGIARMAEATNARYFEENRLAHFWITLQSADRQALADVRAVPGVQTARARFSLDMETTLPGEPTLCVTGYDGPMDINVPIVEEGEALSESDLRGCLVQAGFAQAHDLSPGDPVTVRYGDADYTFFVRGIVYSPEFISVSDGVSADPETYGFILVNARAFAQAPLTQIVVRLEDGADEDAACAALEAALPGAFVVGRSAHRSTAAAQDNVYMFSALSIVFPLAAYVVAALIVMTTLTRMIDKQRMEIGTLRALGFPAGQIQRHYLAYAVWPALIGSVLGAFLGHETLPRLIWALLIGQNEYPYRIIPPISPATWTIVVLTVAMSALICLWTYRRTARETAASLLRPKPPRSGQRILLERIRPLWRRFGFNQKMVARNLLRNKMRTLVSCMGLLSCNALIIASIGLQDSVVLTAENHYLHALGYDVRANLTADADEADAYRARLDAAAVECIMETSVSASFGGQSRTTLLTVVEDGQQMLRLGSNETLAVIEPGGVALTDMLAAQLGVGAGDALTLRLPGDDEPFTLPVGQIVHNNFVQGVYMNRTTWESLRKGAFVPTAVQLLAPTDACIAQLEGMDEVDSLDYTAVQVEDALVSLHTVSSVFLVLTFIALALAFVICYNMGLINFAERTREYATLKVLGYHQREIRRLILRENIIISLVAIALSIWPGIALTDIILIVCETDSVRYVGQVPASAVAISCVATYAFSMFIQRLLVHKVRSIVMVEALKSVE